MTESRFLEKWDECTREQKFQMFKSYCCECGCDDEVYDFDEEFFDMCFHDRPMEAARACVFGDVTWSDPYIKFDGYGNLESLDEYGVEELCDEYVSTIFEHKEYWEDYIEDEEEDDGNEVIADMIHDSFEEVLDTAAVDQYVEDYWRGDLSEEENIQEFKTWYEDTFDEKITLMNED
jgi:hypothetical protein